MVQSNRASEADQVREESPSKDLNLLAIHASDFCRRGLRRAGFDVTHADGTLWGLLSSVFRMREINCVIDVGAHFGEYGRRLRSMGYSGYIHSFEPVSHSYQALKKAVAHDPKWQIYNCALGREEGRQTVNVTSMSVFSSFLAPSEFSRNEYPGDTAVVQTEEVAMATVDSMFDECVRGIHTPRVFLKLDTQGYDLEVLAGASDSAGKIEGMQSELALLHCYDGMTSFGDALSAFRASGYHLAGIFPVGRTSDLRLVEVDCVLVRTPPAL